MDTHVRDFLFVGLLINLTMCAVILFFLFSFSNLINCWKSRAFGFGVGCWQCPANRKKIDFQQLKIKLILFASWVLLPFKVKWINQKKLQHPKYKGTIMTLHIWQYTFQQHEETTYMCHWWDFNGKEPSPNLVREVGISR